MGEGGSIGSEDVEEEEEEKEEPYRERVSFFRPPVIFGVEEPARNSALPFLANEVREYVRVIFASFSSSSTFFKSSSTTSLWVIRCPSWKSTEADILQDDDYNPAFGWVFRVSFKTLAAAVTVRMCTS